MDSSTPEAIGKYAIRRKMGEGAMGVVYEGFDPHIERRVAIKCLHPNMVTADSQGQFLLRFKQEAQAAARCSHPNIVTVLEYGELEHSPYIVMEFVEGVNLQDLLKLKRIKYLKNVISCIGQILNALHAAHEQGVIHRDIKPANVLIMNNGTVKLADFGIARLPTDQFLTQAGVAIGTPRYMSPEQAMAQPTDHRTDLYSLTMMFAEMLTVLTLDNSVIADRIPEIEGLSKGHFVNNSVPVPAAFIPIIIQGLKFSPDRRIQTAQNFLELLKNAVDSLKKPVTDKQLMADAVTEMVLPQRLDPPAVSASPVLEQRHEPALEPEPEAVQTSTQFVDERDLQSLQSILSSYIGPIAQNIVQSEAGRYQEPAELARALASEIDDPAERVAFMRDWERTSGQSSVERSVLSETATGATGATGVNTATAAGTVVPILADNVRDDLVKALAQHVGPLASRLVAMHEQECRSFVELIRAIAEEIPDDEDRRQFEVHFQKA